MKSPRFLGSRFLFWLMVPWLVLGMIALALVAKGCFEDGQSLRGFLAIAFVAICALGLYAMVSKKHGLAIGRVIAVMVPAVYIWYFAQTYFVEGRSLKPTGRKSDSSPFNAICGFVLFGLPSLRFAITGRPFWGKAKDEEPNKAPEPTTMAVTIRAPSSTARASHGRGSS